MNVEPATRALLGQFEQAGGRPVHESSPEEARRAYAAAAALAGPGPAAARRETLLVDGIPVLVSWPEGTGPKPVLVWVHGGGWVLGSADDADPVARSVGLGAGCVVVNVEYRLAPEHVYPAAADDVVSVARWVRDHAAELGVDPARIAVGGDSAGGNLAAVACQRLPGHFAFQLLVYPVTDATLSHPSMTENGEGFLLTKAAMEWFCEHYLPDPELRFDPGVSPLHADAEIVAALPPALVVTAELDPLRDEGEAYAKRLSDNGVAVELVRYAGTVHGFFSMGEAIPLGAEAIDHAATALARALGD